MYVCKPEVLGVAVVLNPVVLFKPGPDHETVVEAATGMEREMVTPKHAGLGVAVIVVLGSAFTVEEPKPVAPQPLAGIIVTE